MPAGLSFRDTAGRLVAFDDLLHQGRPLLVTLGYHRCPMLCGLVLDGLAKALKTGGLTLGRDFTAVSISIDPDEDPKLAADQQKRILALIGATGPGRPGARRGLAVPAGRPGGQPHDGAHRRLSLQVRRAEPAVRAHRRSPSC